MYLQLVVAVILYVNSLSFPTKWITALSRMAGHVVNNSEINKILFQPDLQLIPPASNGGVSNDDLDGGYLLTNSNNEAVLALLRRRRRRNLIYLLFLLTTMLLLVLGLLTSIRIYTYYYQEVIAATLYSWHTLFYHSMVASVH